MQTSQQIGVGTWPGPPINVAENLNDNYNRPALGPGNENH